MTSTSIFVSGLNQPQGLAFDSLGNLYCANSGTSTISKITSDGASVTTFVNSGIYLPRGLAFDNLGNLYCANSGINAINKITSDGTVTIFAIGNGIYQPQGLAFDNLGNLYCANSGNNTISKITSAGAVSPFVDSGLTAPRGLAFDNLGNLYCANSGTNTISKITSTGTVTTFVNNTSGLSSPQGLAFDNSGNLYCANSVTNISKITSAGVVSPFVDSGLSGPQGLAFDSSGILYCANLNNNTITKTVISPSPTLTNFSIPTQTYGYSPFTIPPPTSNSSGSFSYTSSNLSVATIAGNTITIIGVGSSTITATQAASGNYSSGTIQTVFQVNQASPTLTNFSIPTQTYGYSPFTIPPPTSNSSGSFSYTSSNLSVATIAGNTITIIGVGSSTITATQAASGNYSSGAIQTVFQVNQATPTLTNFFIPTQTYGYSPFIISPPTSNSSGSFSYTSSNLSVATIAGNTITIIGAGSSTITATQAASGNYSSGTIQTVFQVNQATPTLTNFSIPTQTYGYNSFTIPPPTSNSSGSFSYTSSNLSVATIAGNTITIIGAGSSTITATQAASGNYSSGAIQTVFQVNQATPTLTNFSITTQTYGYSPFIISPPTSNSSGSFSYTSSNLSVATIAGNTITIIGAGSSTITATQAASGNYSSGTIQTVFQVNQATPTLTNFSIPTQTYGYSPFTIPPPTSNSSGSFSYTSSNLSVATIAGNTITIIGAGSSTITATQAASGNYSSGTIQTVFQVNQATPTLTNFPNQTFTNVYTFQYPFTYNLTQPQSNSSGAFSYSSSNTQTATVSGNTVTVRNAGNSIITATQPASGNYSAGSITSSLMVSNICFPAGTPITTDQGEIAIEKINPDIHTIRNKKIVDITKTVSTSDFLVCFEKHSLCNNIPSRKTVMTKDHEIFFKGKMIRAIDFMDKYENVHKVKYSGEPLYNVLLEKHDKMMVNNLICETLNPENPIAKVYGMLKSYSVEEQERLIKECNKITVNNNKFSSKQLEKINRHI